MRFHPTAIVSFLAVGVGSAHGFAPPQIQQGSLSSQLHSTAASLSTADTSSGGDGSQPSSTMSKMDTLTTDLISKLRFRQVQKELELRQLETKGTFTELKQRLKHVAVDGTATTSGTSTRNGDSGMMVIDDNALNSVRVTSYVACLSMRVFIILLPTVP
jgi:hypothetical protein